MAGCRVSEQKLAPGVFQHLTKGMLCLVDRNFFGYEMWKSARATGADHLWRVKRNKRLEFECFFDFGSYLSTIYPTDKDRRQKTNIIPVRFIEYRANVPGAEPFYRLVTSILDPKAAPAIELAALYFERWEIETSFDELKTHLRGARVILRSKSADLVRQEIIGLMLAHCALRSLMHEAALKADIDPDRLSFIHCIRVVRRKLVRAVTSPTPELHRQVIDELLDEPPQTRRVRRNKRGVKQKMSPYSLKRRTDPKLEPVDFKKAIRLRWPTTTPSEPNEAHYNAAMGAEFGYA